MSSSSYIVALEPVDYFVASEEVDRHHVKALAQSIKACGHWLVPIPVERQSGLVMDGNHRLRAARLLGLKRLPCVPLDYDDERVQVHCWQSGLPFDIERILDMATRRAVFPYKTTRHNFDPALPCSRIPLSLLAHEVEERVSDSLIRVRRTALSK